MKVAAPAFTIQSYRDKMILFLGFAAADCRRPIEALERADFTADRVGHVSIGGVGQNSIGANNGGSIYS